MFMPLDIAMPRACGPPHGAALTVLHRILWSAATSTPKMRFPSREAPPSIGAMKPASTTSGPWRGVRMRRVAAGADPDAPPRPSRMPAAWDDRAAAALADAGARRRRRSALEHGRRSLDPADRRAARGRRDCPTLGGAAARRCCWRRRGAPTAPVWRGAAGSEPGLRAQPARLPRPVARLRRCRLRRGGRDRDHRPDAGGAGGGAASASAWPTSPGCWRRSGSTTTARRRATSRPGIAALLRGRAEAASADLAERFGALAMARAAAAGAGGDGDPGARAGAGRGARGAAAARPARRHAATDGAGAPGARRGAARRRDRRHRAGVFAARRRRAADPHRARLAGRARHHGRGGAGRCAGRPLAVPAGVGAPRMRRCTTRWRRSSMRMPVAPPLPAGRPAGADAAAAARVAGAARRLHAESDRRRPPAVPAHRRIRRRHPRRDLRSRCPRKARRSAA